MIHFKGIVAFTFVISYSCKATFTVVKLIRSLFLWLLSFGEAKESNIIKREGVLLKHPLFSDPGGIAPSGRELVVPIKIGTPRFKPHQPFGFRPSGSPEILFTSTFTMKQKKQPLRLLLRDPGGTQTPNLLIRSQMLYSVKLRDHPIFCGCKYSKFLFSLIFINFKTKTIQ